MKTFVANGPVAIDIDEFKLSIHRTKAGTTSKSLIIKDVSGSFSVTRVKCGDITIDVDENLCIVSRKRIITGLEIYPNENDGEYSSYAFKGTDIQPYGS